MQPARSLTSTSTTSPGRVPSNGCTKHAKSRAGTSRKTNGPAPTRRRTTSVCVCLNDRAQHHPSSIPLARERSTHLSLASPATVIDYIDHYNTHRPHRSLEQQPPTQRPTNRHRCQAASLCSEQPDATVSSTNTKTPPEHSRQSFRAPRASVHSIQIHTLLRPSPAPLAVPVHATLA
jgi:hypothetical protein